MEFSPQINCLVGDNGVGKTNILDALHYLSVRKSFLGNSDLNNITAVQPLLDVNGLTAQQWLLLFAKEAFLGLAMGAMLAAVLWAFHAAGEIVDGASGMSMAQIVDPLSGRQTSLTGAFLGHLAVFMFMFSGSMLLWVGALMESFALWFIHTKKAFPTISLSSTKPQ